MTEQIVEKALQLWGMGAAEVTLAAHRENTVFKVTHENEIFALRLHRPGYRTFAELQSELEWMEELNSNGLNTPEPIASEDGSFCHEFDNVVVDVLTWLEGQTLTAQLQSANSNDIQTTYGLIGEAMGQLHLISDDWVLPPEFKRPSWDLTGLLGDRPVWGRFWENPSLSRDQKLVFENAREKAVRTLMPAAAKMDYGLIHADIIPDNVLIGSEAIRLIDFDDGGFGYRLFDLATTLNKMPDTPHKPAFESAFLDGYRKVRDIDLEHLQLFRALRAFTYIGWIMDRQDHPGSEGRSEKFIAAALSHIAECEALAA